MSFSFLTISGFYMAMLYQTKSPTILILKLIAGHILGQPFLDFSSVILHAQALNWTMLLKTVKRRPWLLLGDKQILANPLRSLL
jgi:hypothetical protein